MIKLKIFVLIGLILLASCDSPPLLDGTIETTRALPSMAITTMTVLPSSTITAIPTQFPATLTRTATTSPTLLVPTTTPTIPSEARLRLQCLDIAPSLPAQANAKGTIVLDSAHADQIYLRNMETGDQLSLLQEGEGAFEPAVSPDGQWLAYLGGKVQRGESFWLLVVSAGGQEQAAIPPGEEWEYLSGWLDNQRLILSGLLVPGDAYTPVVPSLVLNPFTGERQELPPAPLDLYTLYPYPNWLGRGMISYDPALRYRVYPNQNYDLVFEDLQTHEILTQFLVPIWDAVPRWSPDGQQFVITKAENYTPGPVDYELYNVSIDGQVTQLTKLTTYYNETYIPYYDWSPDGNHLAFWLETDPEDENSIDLVVLDTVTFDVVNYCVTSHYRGNTTPPLFWSPDSRQLVMEIDDANDSTLKRVVVVDIVDGWAAQIAEDMEPVGWMVSP